MRSFCRKTHVHKIPRFRGGGILGFGGGGETRFYFYGRADFSETSAMSQMSKELLNASQARPPIGSQRHRKWTTSNSNHLLHSSKKIAEG